MEHRTEGKRINKTAVAGYTPNKLDKQIFEAILLQEAMPMGNVEEKVTKILERIQKA